MYVVGESPEMQAWRITCQRCAPRFVPNACVPLPVRRQCLRSAANKAAASGRRAEGNLALRGLLCALLARWTWVQTGCGTRSTMVVRTMLLGIFGVATGLMAKLVAGYWLP